MMSDIDEQFSKVSLEVTKLKDLVMRDGTDEQVEFLRNVLHSMDYIKWHISAAEQGEIK